MQKHSPSPNQEIGRSSEQKNNATQVLAGDNKSAPASGIYTDKNKLPVMYDAALGIPAAKSPKAETNIISVLWHELITPLTVIKGYASTLLQLEEAITEEQKQQYLRGIDSASNRVIRLLENLRDITKLEETDAITMQRIPLLDLLRQTASEMQNQTRQHIIKILPCPRLPLVKADPEKIEMVLNNLLINAVKYSPQGGDIELGLRMVRNEPEMTDIFPDAPQVKLPCIVVSVADKGIGLPEAELERIFEKFYRVKNRLSPVTPGAGLGLYICKIIVEAHNGRIWARNRSGGGSVFRFSLPLDKVV
jgi:two-component system, OmpR family, sensor histidine kinase KdpD